MNKVTLWSAVNAIGSLRNLTNMKFHNWNKALAIATALKTVEERVDFYLKHEGDLINEYACKKEDGTLDTDELGRFHFDTVEIKDKFVAELNELKNTTFNFTPIHINVKDFKEGEATLTPNEINSLDKFIIFDVFNEEPKA